MADDFTTFLRAEGQDVHTDLCQGLSCPCYLAGQAHPHPSAVESILARSICAKIMRDGEDGGCVLTDRPDISDSVIDVHVALTPDEVTYLEGFRPRENP